MVSSRPLTLPFTENYFALTIDIQSEYIGRRAVEQLCWRIQNPDDPTTIEIKIKPELVVPVVKEGLQKNFAG